MVQVTQQNGVTVLCTGPKYTGLENQALDELANTLLAEIARSSPPRIVIDMTRTEYIASSFIELMIRAWKRVKHDSGTMALCAVHSYCQEVLRVSHLDTVWPIYATRDEAIRAV